jgi:uncharacterized protein YdhG (YjbR/CyaY superfamily)
MAKADKPSVDQYLSKQPKNVAAVLRRVRAIIRKAVPSLEEGISYQVPAYKLDGEIVIYFAGWKEHYALYPALEVAESFAQELARYEVSKGTIRFPLDEPVPDKLIARIVKFRAKLAGERATLKAARVKAKRKPAAKSKLSTRAR